MIKGLIKKKLEKTLDCEFKQAFIPKGFACVKIDTFADELAEEIGEKEVAIAGEWVKLKELY